jgi:Protein of unknown function (DUF4054)
MIVPSASNMKFKFPEFNTVDDASIEFAIEEAVVVCGNGDWIDDANQTLALMYYAAHLLMVSIMRAQSGTGQVVSSERTPELSITYAVPQQPSLNEPIDLTMTIYGVRYLGLVARNFPAVLTVNCAVSP